MKTISTNWKHTSPSPAEKRYDMQLLTVMGVSVLGRWKSVVGQHYSGWAPLLSASPAQLLPYPIPEVPDLFLLRPEKANYVN